MDQRFITNLQGKDFVLFEGLLNEFHENGGKSIITEIILIDPLIIQATVEGEKGLYQGIGDADESNVNRLIAKHKIRMAETRAIARALRWYNNIGMCSADELGGDDSTKTSTRKPLEAQNDDIGPIEAIMGDNALKVCPVCRQAHKGKYDKCLDCWKKQKDGQAF